MPEKTACCIRHFTNDESVMSEDVKPGFLCSVQI